MRSKEERHESYLERERIRKAKLAERMAKVRAKGRREYTPEEKAHANLWGAAGGSWGP